MEEEGGPELRWFGRNGSPENRAREGSPRSGRIASGARVFEPGSSRWGMGNGAVHRLKYGGRKWKRRQLRRAWMPRWPWQEEQRGRRPLTSGSR